jgi:ATP-dependent RNA helicase DDX5/DBP2
METKTENTYAAPPSRFSSYPPSNSGNNFGSWNSKYSGSRDHNNHHASNRDNNHSSRDYSRDHSRDERKPYNNSYNSFRPSYNSQDKEKQREYERDNRDNSKQKGKFSDVGSNLSKIDWSSLELSTFQKNFYNESSTVKDRPQSEVDKYRAEHQIAIRSAYGPRPVTSFEETGFPSYIKDQLITRFKTPSPIQSQGWPSALGGNDVIGIAQTGSGKTISFLLPGFVHINAQPALKYGDGPIMLVLAPTRELAMQIQEECLKFSRDAKVYTTCVYGGTDKWSQKRELQKGNHIVVATPGRLLDFLEMGVINLKRITYLVLDEADRMLDMGFEPQIRKIVSQIRPDRQTLMYSATWPKEIQKLALEFCREKPVHVVIGSKDLSVNLKIKQNVEVMDNSMKQFRVAQLLQTEMTNSKILIFTQTKKGADQLSYFLGTSGVQAHSIHGDKTQGQRDFIMRQFKTGRTSILVATDLAARGLDVADIKFVINFDFPTNIEDYIHRVGRTGRAGREGVSYTFFSRSDYKHSYKLIDILEETDQFVPDDLYRIARRPVPRRASTGNVAPQQQYQQQYQKPSHSFIPAKGNY